MCCVQRSKKKIKQQAVFFSFVTNTYTRLAVSTVPFGHRPSHFLHFPNSTLIHLIGARAAFSYTCPMVCHDIVVWEKKKKTPNQPFTPESLTTTNQSNTTQHNTHNTHRNWCSHQNHFCHGYQVSSFICHIHDYTEIVIPAVKWESVPLHGQCKYRKNTTQGKYTIK